MQIITPETNEPLFVIPELFSPDNLYENSTLLIILTDLNLVNENNARKKNYNRGCRKSNYLFLSDGFKMYRINSRTLNKTFGKHH